MNNMLYLYKTSKLIMTKFYEELELLTDLEFMNIGKYLLLKLLVKKIEHITIF